MNRRGAVAAVAAALLMGPLAGPATAGGDGLSRGEMREKLAEAIADEKRALRHLRASPPRIGPAKTTLLRSAVVLGEILRDPAPGTGGAQSAIEAAEAHDVDANLSLSEDPAEESDVDGAILRTSLALQFKQVALAALRRPSRAGRSQCNDGRDNNGNGLEDARFDPGCSSRRDGTESGRLRCTAERVAGSSDVIAVDSECNGPFARTEFVVPSGSSFDTRRMPLVSESTTCRFVGERRIDCVMQDGRANRGHDAGAQLPIVQEPAEVKYFVRDFRGRRREVPVAPLEMPPPMPPFSLGSDPRRAGADFTGGEGSCAGVPSQFSTPLDVLAPGDGVVRITQPSQPNAPPATGPVAPSGAFEAGNAGEAYRGMLTQSGGSGTYSYNGPNGCTHGWDFTLAFGSMP